MPKPVAIVTAAGRGMGAAIARELHSAGYDLVLMSSGEGAETVAKEVGAISLRGSVADPDDLADLVDTTFSTQGRIDAVVNNTGHPPKGPLLEIANDDWHRALDLVLLNVVTMARLVTPIMLEQGGGSIVNISTFGAVEPDQAFPVSSALRAALGAFTKLYADEYAPAGIRMNSILPGFIDSYPVTDDNLARIPMGRYGMVTEVARTVRFLLSDDAGYITGSILSVNGGLEMQ